MTRTRRKDRKTRRPVRDGAPQYPSGACEHRGGCPVCEGNMTHKNRRRMVAATDAARNPPPPHTLVNAIQDGNHKESSERRTATVVRRPATDAATSGEEE